jgi:hypothetical protein
MLGLVACGPPVFEEALEPGFTCEPMELSEGEVRVKAWGCDDESPSNSSARRGDWFLQNSRLTVVVRSPAEAYTVLDLPGGTLVDVTPVGRSDWLWEAVPLVGGAWIRARLLETGSDDGAWIRLTGPGLEDGLERSVTYRLRADSSVLEIEGADGLYLHGDRRTEAAGPGLLRDDLAWRTDATGWTDLGGAQVLEGVTALAAGSLEEVHEALPGTQAVSGTCSGDRVDVLLDGELVDRLPAEFSALIGPADSLVCGAEGFADGAPVAPGEDLVLEPGGEGWLTLRVVDEAGRELPARVTVERRSWGQGSWPEALPVGEGSFEVRVDAGPTVEPWSGTVDVVGSVTEQVVLERAFEAEGWLLADLFRAPWPAVDGREEQLDDLRLAAGLGVGFAVQAPPNEVGRPYQNDWTETRLRAVEGSAARTDEVGTVWSWPWIGNEKRSAHGAVKWAGLSAQDVLALADGYESPDRVTVVDMDWVRSSPDFLAQWPDRPDLVRLEGVEDFEELQALLDQGWIVGFAGPLTWTPADLETLPSVAAAERGLVTGQSVATSGPLLELSVRPSLEIEQPWLATVELSARRAEPVEQIELWVDGELVATGQDRIELQFAGEMWAVAVARGEGWAVSSPVLLR